MFRRIYINNFRCLENFDLPISGKASALLIGRNRSGKSTVGLALQLVQRIARGTNRIGDLVKKAGLGPLEKIGFQLALECEIETRETWNHALLRHNQFELERMSSRIRNILFQMH